MPAEPRRGITSATSKGASCPRRRSSMPRTSLAGARETGMRGLTNLIPSSRCLVREQTEDLAGSGIQRLAHVLSQAEHRVTRQLGQLLEDDGCSIEQWRALELLADGTSHRMSELAAFTLLPAPTLTRLVDRMVSDNLAYRKADPQDGRRVLVLITPRGRRLHEHLTERIEREQGGAFSDADTGVVVRVTALLVELLARLRP